MLHSVLDQGSIGWPSRQWLFEHLRGARWFDPPHRRCNNLSEALSVAGLGHLRAEALHVLNHHGGPWAGAANHSAWVQCAMEYLASTDVDDPIFGCMYPYMAHDLRGGRLPYNFGSREHTQAARGALTLAAQEKPKGAVVRLNRWFQVCTRTRPTLKHWIRD